MSDQCKNCTVRGDYEACIATPCSKHESWIDTTRSERIKELEKQVEAMGMPKTCRTCSSYAEYYEPVTNYNRQTNTCLDSYAHGKGPRFGCIHHKETPQPPVKK